MTQGRRPLIPEWAVQERLSDLAWIQENLAVFWPAAQAQYRCEGRGADPLRSRYGAGGGS